MMPGAMERIFRELNIPETQVHVPGGSAAWRSLEDRRGIAYALGILVQGYRESLG